MTPATRTLLPYWQADEADSSWLAMAEFAGVILSHEVLLNAADCGALGSRSRSSSPGARPLLVTADPSALWQTGIAEVQPPAQIGDDYALSREAMEVTLAGMTFGRWLADRDVDAVLSPSLDLASVSSRGACGSQFSSNTDIVAAAASSYLDGLHAAGVLASGSFSHVGDSLQNDAASSVGAAISHGLELLHFCSATGWQEAGQWLRQEIGFDGPLMAPLLDDLVSPGADEVVVWAGLLHAGYDLVPVKDGALRARLMRRLIEQDPAVPVHSRLRVETLLADWLGD